ncbi:MAG: general secretion pathway protein D, partial [Verrucomicrobiales bacterium]
TEDGDRLIKQLKRRRKFEIMSAPSVVSRQGQSAKVEIIREFIYPTEFDPPKIREVKKEFDTVSGSFPVTPATPTKFGKKDVGFTAEFKGRRTSGGGIDVQFNIGQVSFLGFVNYGSPISTTAQTARGRPVNIVLTENKIVQPVFGTKRLASRVTFPNGHYIAIGGIRQETQKSLDDNIHPTPGQIEEDKNLFALIKVTAVKP